MAPGIEGEIGAAVQPLADPRHHRVVHRGVTQRTGDAHPREDVLAVLVFHRAFDPHDRVQLDQRDRGGGALQIGRLQDPRGQRVRIDLQAYREGRRGVHRLGDRFMQAQGVGPEGLVPVGVIAEDVLPAGRPRRGLGATPVCGARQRHPDDDRQHPPTPFRIPYHEVDRHSLPLLNRVGRDGFGDRRSADDHERCHFRAAAGGRALGRGADPARPGRRHGHVRGPHAPLQPAAVSRGARDREGPRRCRGRDAAGVPERVHPLAPIRAAGIVCELAHPHRRPRGIRRPPAARGGGGHRADRGRRPS